MITPLKYCRKFTVWKGKGKYIRGKVVYDLIRSDKEYGLTYTEFYRDKIYL